MHSDFCNMQMQRYQMAWYSVIDNVFLFFLVAIFCHNLLEQNRLVDSVIKLVMDSAETYLDYCFFASCQP